jgi:uncharacterized delta-60 repeat protein
LLAQVILASPVNAAPGDLDASFGIGGKVTTDVGGYDEVLALTIQPDGRIVAAGATFNGSTGGSDFVVARYKTDGSLDLTFGSGGVATTDFAGRIDIATGVALQSDGKIIVCGLSRIGTDHATSDFALARYTANGALDPTFGVGGRVFTDFGGSADSAGGGVVIQPNGKIVAGGTVTSNASGTISDFGLARYSADGSLDQTFGQGGRVVTNIENHSASAAAMVLQPDGRIVLGGGAGDLGLALARYEADGSLDPTFGVGGIAIGMASGTSATGLALEPSGKLVAAGPKTTLIPPSQLASDFGVERLNPDGSLDPTFGTGGRVTTDIGGDIADDDFVADVAIQADGKIVVAGNSFGTHRIALARYNSNGSLDAGFGTGGVSLTTPFVDLVAVALQPDGKIVAGGLTSGEADMALARYQSTTAPPAPTISSFSPLSGPVGTSVTIFGGNFAGASSVGFSGVAQPSFTVDPTGSLITAAVPPGATTGAIQVTTPYGTATSLSSFTVTAGAHERNVTLSLRKHLVAKGNVVVTDGYASCFQNMHVRIQRRISDHWRTIATDQTDADGSFTHRLPDRTGWYRASVNAVTLSSGDVCDRAISGTRHHNRSG